VSDREFINLSVRQKNQFRLYRPLKAMAQPISTPIWQLRALQNWGHQVLISEICEQDISVAQIGCASGLDLGKWY
jgi:hypothetical protein